MPSPHAERLEMQIRARPELSDTLRLGAVIIEKRNRSVFEAQFEGKDVILKQYRTETARERVEQEARATQERADLLRSSQSAFAPHVLLSQPDLGFYVMEKVQGVAGDMFLSPDDPPMAYLFPSAALWLKACVEASAQSNQIALGYWERLLKRPPTENKVPQKKRALYAAVAERTLQLLPNAAGSITKTLGHGDFQPCNLLIDEDQVCAIDFQSTQMVPAAREIAHFIIKSNALCLTQGTQFGVDPALITPFQDLLPEGELDRLLPLFLGVELLASFQHDHRWRAQSVERRDALAARFIAH